MTESDDVAVCPACLCPLPATATGECPECKAPLTTAATFDHLAIISAQGEVLRRGASNPSGIVVVGMWLLFGPTSLTFVLLALSSGPLGLVTSVPILLLYVAILWKVTSRYFAARRESSRHDAAEPRYDEPGHDRFDA
jgi:hypothetical protein